MSGFDPVAPKRIDPKVTAAPADEVRHGTPDGPPDVRLLGGYFVFDSPDAALLGSLLPAVIHVRGAERLSTLVRLVGEESSEAETGPRARAHAPRRGTAHRSAPDDAG